MSSYSLVERRYRRLVRQVLYGLRNQYGSRIVVYKLLDAETDYSTGVKSIDKISYELVAITTPGKVGREVLQSISQISANKTMVYGGTFDSTVKTFAIDGRHLPDDFEFGMDDWIVYNNARFELKDIYKLDYHAGWIITAKEIIGQHAEQIFHEQASNRLCLDSYADAVPWTAHFLGHTIPINHDVSVQKVMYRSAENILPLDQDVTYQGVFNRSVNSDVGIDHSVNVSKVIYANASSNIGVDHYLSLD